MFDAVEDMEFLTPVTSPEVRPVRPSPMPTPIPVEIVPKMPPVVVVVEVPPVVVVLVVLLLLELLLGVPPNRSVTSPPKIFVKKPPKMLPILEKMEPIADDPPEGVVPAALGVVVAAVPLPAGLMAGLVVGVAAAGVLVVDAAVVVAISSLHSNKDSSQDGS